LGDITSGYSLGDFRCSSGLAGGEALIIAQLVVLDARKTEPFRTCFILQELLYKPFKTKMTHSSVNSDGSSHLDTNNADDPLTNSQFGPFVFDHHP
jgi:hypothetical protein